MDPILIGVIVVVALGIAVWFLNKDSNDDVSGGGESGLRPTPVKPTPAPKAPVSERVQALKSADAVKSAPAAKKLPTKTALLKLTKAKIEETGREFDIELDKRMTKENMVSTFLKEARAAAKADRK